MSHDVIRITNLKGKPFKKYYFYGVDCDKHTYFDMDGVSILEIIRAVAFSAYGKIHHTNSQDELSDMIDGLCDELKSAMLLCHTDKKINDQTKEGYWG